MAYTTINKSTDYFNTVAYTGNGASDRAVTSGFATDFVWIKNRGTTDDHVLFDKVRGGTKYLYSNQTAAEATYSSQDVTFESTGVDVGSYQSINQNSGNIVSWHWRGNGAGSSNSDGSITSTVSANTTAGFSIVSYTGTGSNATVGHGLGVAPKMIIIKNLNASQGWCVYHESIGATKFLSLNSTDAQVTASDRFNDTSPTSSVFSVGSHADTNGSGDNMIAYCFAEKTGYSKFGTYTGNGNADGTFVYTGFKPAFLIIKKTNATKNWFLHDDKRLGYNPSNSYVNPNLSAVEYAGTDLDIVSNGFKMRSTGGGHNESGHTYIYMAIGQSLVGSNNIPATAR
jgi:hypothetical protein